MGPGISAGGDLFTDGTTPGLKAARSRTRLRYGTLEPVASMHKGKAQAEAPRGREYQMTGRTPVCEAQGRNDP